MQITFNFSELWFIFCLGQPKSILKKALSRPLHFTLMKFSALIKDLYRNLRNFQWLPLKFKDFSSYKDISPNNPSKWSVEFLSLRRWAYLSFAKDCFIFVLTLGSKGDEGVRALAFNQYRSVRVPEPGPPYVGWVTIWLLVVSLAPKVF